MAVNPIHGSKERFTDAAALARAAAEGFAERAVEAVRESGRFAVALTGGNSPRVLYSLLARPDVSATIPWEQVHLFWGDDRCVPPAHPRSNFGMADALFISRVPIPSNNVHRIRGEMPPPDAARLYAEELAGFFGDELPRFDLVHLGLGDDAHVASLFPFDSRALTERSAPVLTSLRLPEGEPRVSLSPAAINRARRVEFLLPSPDKAEIARRAMHGPLDPLRLPAQLIDPADGDLVWMTVE